MPPPSALQGSVPSAPVVVSAEEVRRKLAPPPPPTHSPDRNAASDASLHAPSGHSLDDLLRELAARQPAGLSF